MDDLNTSNVRLLEEIQRLRTELATGKLMAENRTAELYKSEERFSLAMRGANDGLWDWNLETDEVYYSPHWKSMLGYAESELESNLNTWANLVHPDDKDSVLEKAQDYLDGRADSFEVEMRMQHKEGHEVVVLSRGFKVAHDSDKKAVRLVGTHVDITEHKKTATFNVNNSKILEMIPSEVTSSASASNVNSTRCRSTSGAIALTSSGTTYARPRRNACARAAWAR